MTNTQQVDFLSFCKSLNETQQNILHTMLEALNSETMKKSSREEVDDHIIKAFEKIKLAA